MSSELEKGGFRERVKSGSFWQGLVGLKEFVSGGNAANREYTHANDGNYLIFADEEGGDKIRRGDEEENLITAWPSKSLYAEASIGDGSIPVVIDLKSFNKSNNSVLVSQGSYSRFDVPGFIPFRMQLWQNELGVLFLKEVPFCHPDSIPLLPMVPVVFPNLSFRDVSIGLKIDELEKMLKSS